MTKFYRLFPVPYLLTYLSFAQGRGGQLTVSFLVTC